MTQKFRILYVDRTVNEKETCELLERLTERLSSVITIFSVVPNVFCGLEYTEHGCYDLVMVLGGNRQLDAIHMLRILRNVSAPMPVVLILDRHDPTTEVEAQRAGFFGSIRKNFTVESLVSIIDRAIQYQSTLRADIKHAMLQLGAQSACSSSQDVHSRGPQLTIPGCSETNMRGLSEFVETTSMPVAQERCYSSCSGNQTTKLSSCLNQEPDLLSYETWARRHIQAKSTLGSSQSTSMNVNRNVDEYTNSYQDSLFDEVTRATSADPMEIVRSNEQSSTAVDSSGPRKRGRKRKVPQPPEFDAHQVLSDNYAGRAQHSGTKSSAETRRKSQPSISRASNGHRSVATTLPDFHMHNADVVQTQIRKMSMIKPRSGSDISAASTGMTMQLPLIRDVVNAYWPSEPVGQSIDEPESSIITLLIPNVNGSPDTNCNHILELSDVTANHLISSGQRAKLTMVCDESAPPARCQPATEGFISLDDTTSSAESTNSNISRNCSNSRPANLKTSNGIANGLTRNQGSKSGDLTSLQLLNECAFSMDTFNRSGLSSVLQKRTRRV